MKKNILGSVLLCVLLLYGCNTPSTPNHPTEKSTVETLPTGKVLTSPTISSAKDATPTTAPSVTISVTSLPTLGSSPSATSVPILDKKSAELRIAELMRTNSNCSVPCFWGITPGITDVSQALNYLQPISNKKLKTPIDTKMYDFWGRYLYNQDIIKVDIGFHAIGQDVENLNVKVSGLQDERVTTEGWLAFRPDSMLKTYGAPERVSVIMGQGPEGRLGYEMILLYPSQKMYIKYSGNQLVILPQKIIHACPLMNNNISDFELGLGKYDESILTQGVEITQLTTMSMPKFYQVMLMKPNEACFDLDYGQYPQ